MSISRLFLVFFLAQTGFITLEAQTFKPLTALRVIRTDHFDIIYPPESEPTARMLADKADGIYRRVSGLLGISLDRRVPVSITPHTDQFNGYMRLLPYPHIVLYDTPMDIEMTTYGNSLEGLFLHELTHAISMSSRDPSYRRLYTVFGGWVSPSIVTSPAFMTEGVTVSFESLDGFGRANDPLVKQRLRQAVYEDAFLTPFQASGIYEYPNNRSAYYEYGGLFSAWLQNTYGMEKYAALWQAMGSDYHFSFFFYNNGYFNMFKNVYGMPFLQAWSVFEESLEIETIEENPQAPVYEGLVPGPLFLPRKGAVIAASAAADGRVYFLDTLAQGALSYDPVSGQTRRVASADSSAYSLDVSPDGERLLVSSYRYKGDLARAVVTEYAVGGGISGEASRGKTGRAWQGLYQARYFRDGLIGLSSDLHNNNLVFRPGRGGEEQVLLRGNEELLYGSPAAVNETWLAFVAAKKGKRELCLYNFDTREVYTLGSDLPDDGERWRYIRSVQVASGYLLFAFNHDEGMYKLGAIDLAGIGPGPLPGDIGAVFTERDFSGGVSQPVVVGGEIYYAGTFFKWDALLRYPESAASLTGTRAALSPRPWADEDLARALPDAPSAGGGGGSGMTALLPDKRYIGISYLNPFKLWVPLPLVRLTPGRLSLDGAGFFSFMSDPTDTNLVFLFAYMDVRSLMAAGSLQWINYSLGFPLELDIADDIDKTGNTPYRITQASLTGTLSFGLGNERNRFDIQPGIAAILQAEDTGDGSNPYTWNYDKRYYTASLGMGFSNRIRPSWALFGQGLSLRAYGRVLLNQPGIPRLDGVFDAALEPWVPLRFRFYGAWDPEGMDLWGQSDYYPNTPFDSTASFEYPHQRDISLAWLAGGEAELKIFSLDIQRNLSHAYFNRIYGTLAYRGAFYDDQGQGGEGVSLGGSSRLAQSLVLRLGATISTVIIAAVPFSFTPFFWGSWKFPNIHDDNGSNDYSLGLGFSVSY